MPKTEWVDLPKLQDYSGPIDLLIATLSKYRQQYGNKVRVRLEAGYNNVSVQVEQRVKPEKPK